MIEQIHKRGLEMIKDSDAHNMALVQQYARKVLELSTMKPFSENENIIILNAIKSLGESIKKRMEYSLEDKTYAGSQTGLQGHVVIYRM